MHFSKASRFGHEPDDDEDEVEPSGKSVETSLDIMREYQKPTLQSNAVVAQTPKPPTWPNSARSSQPRRPRPGSSNKLYQQLAFANLLG